jgi:hypothetical protein
MPRGYRGVPFQAISESTADDLVGRGIRRDLVRVIYPGIDTEAFTPDASRRAAVPTFAYLGRLKRYKGVDLVLRAFAGVRHPDARLEIAGAGDYRPALERLADSLALGGRVRFLGRVSEADKLDLLRRAWALAFASPKEGWGITNLEAAACATPVVASSSPGLRESVRDGRPDIWCRTATSPRWPPASRRSPPRPRSSRRWARRRVVSPSRSRGSAPLARRSRISPRSSTRECAAGSDRRAREGSRMQIVFHAHHAELSETAQQRASATLRKLAERLRRVVDATVRVATDGPLARVEVTLRGPRREPLVGRRHRTPPGTRAHAGARPTRRTRRARPRRAGTTHQPAAPRVGGRTRWRAPRRVAARPGPMGGRELRDA